MPVTRTLQLDEGRDLDALVEYIRAERSEPQDPSIQRGLFHILTMIETAKRRGVTEIEVEFDSEEQVERCKAVLNSALSSDLHDLADQL